MKLNKEEFEKWLKDTKGYDTQDDVDGCDNHWILHVRVDKDGKFWAVEKLNDNYCGEHEGIYDVNEVVKEEYIAYHWLYKESKTL